MIGKEDIEQHSPGPWYVEEDYAYEVFIYDKLGKRVAQIDGHNLAQDDPFLIALAPSLLEENNTLRQALRLILGTANGRALLVSDSRLVALLDEVDL